MELEGIMLSEISQVEKEKYQMISLFGKYNNKAKLKEQNSSRLTDSKKAPAVTKGKESGEGGWGERERRGLRGNMIVTHNVGCRGVMEKTV